MLDYDASDAFHELLTKEILFFPVKNRAIALKEIVLRGYL